MTTNRTELLDTNIIVRAVEHRPEDQYEKVRALLRRPGIKYQISPVAISEAVYVLTRTLGHSREKAIFWLRRFLNLPNMEYDFEYYDKVFELFVGNKSLSYGDCCLAVEAEMTGVEPLWTFDQALAKKSPAAKLVA